MQDLAPSVHEKASVPLVRCVFAAALLLSGCGGNAVQDALRLDVDSATLPLTLSTLCTDATCAGDEELAVAIVYAPGLPKSETAELDQYRVDYELDGVKGRVPFFAAPKKLLLNPGQRNDMHLAVTSASQRSFLVNAIGHGTATGWGTLTFAGYDKDNAQIFVETRFELRYGEFPLDGAASTKVGPSGSDAGMSSLDASVLDASVSDASTF